MGAPVGNNNAGKGKLWDGALRRALNEDREALLEIARNVVAAAKEGKEWAINHLAERLDGKAVQHIAGSIEHTVTTGDGDSLRERLGRKATEHAAQDTVQ